MALEGVRGLAALVVVLHHFLLAFFPYLNFGPTAVQHMRFEDNIFGTPLALPFAGTFAVAIFFVLSGFVLTIGFFQTKDHAIIKKLATKRYIRLMLPALAATIICFLLMTVGFATLVQNTALLTQSEWLRMNWNFNPNFIEALYSGTFGIFTQNHSIYNNVLWTMTTEFAGSFIVFGFVLLFGKSKHRWLSYLLVGVFTFNTWFLPFILGMALADLHASGVLEKLKGKKWLTGSALTLGLLLGAFPHANAENTAYKYLVIDPGFPVEHQMLYLTIGATLLIFGILNSRRVTELLEKPKVSVLGRYTFSLYLIHIPVIYSVGLLAFVFLLPYTGYNIAVILTLLILVPIIGVATFMFEKYVDAPSIQFSKVVAEVFEGQRTLNLRKRVIALQRRAVNFFRPIRQTPDIEEAPAE